MKCIIKVRYIQSYASFFKPLGKGTVLHVDVMHLWNGQSHLIIKLDLFGSRSDTKRPNVSLVKCVYPDYSSLLHSLISLANPISYCKNIERTFESQFSQTTFFFTQNSLCTVGVKGHTYHPVSSRGD